MLIPGTPSSRCTHSTCVFFLTVLVTTGSGVRKFLSAFDIRRSVVGLCTSFRSSQQYSACSRHGGWGGVSSQQYSAVHVMACWPVLVEGFCLFLSGLLSSVLLFVSRRCADLRTCLFISSSLLSSAMLFMSRQRAGCVVVAGVQVSFRHSVDVRIRPHVWLR